MTAHKAARSSGTTLRRRLTAATFALCGIAGLGVANVTTTASAAPVKAFPGAQGYGTDTPGGRGGRVIAVTNLNDSGAGSLRAALTATGPRYVIFRVGGTITLQSDISITSPFVTVAGQTAPGGGVLIRSSASNTKGLLDVEANDVVIRHLRFRVGPGGEGKGLDISPAARVVIDHNSFSWAVDENATSYDDATDITFSWNIFSEGLSNSTHGEGEHSRGFFMSGTNSARLTAHHNLMAHNMRRNPEVNTAGTTDVRNNVAYDWGTHAHMYSDKNGAHCVNVVGNYFKTGPSTSGDREEIDGYVGDGAPGMDLYTSGNVMANGASARLDSVAKGWQVPTPCPGTPAVSTTSAEQAYVDVLAGAGATHPRRDAVDARIVDEVKNRSGGIIDSPADVGGWPTIAAGTAPADGDGDGMPDSFETAHGTNPNVADANGDEDGDGYTNVEDWFNGLTGTTAATAPSSPAPAPASAPASSTTGTPSPTPPAEPSTSASAQPTAASTGSPTAASTGSPTATSTGSPTAASTTPTTAPSVIPTDAARLVCPAVRNPVAGQQVTCTYQGAP
jgi:pectate lyase